jgi:septal ring factor EnvC (AmiA/AmiB activator)
MRPPIRFVAAAAATVILGFGVAPAAHADDTPAPSDNAPCAKQQAKVDKAEDALARVQAVFAKQKDHLADAQAELAAAETDKDKAKAQKKVDFWTAKLADTKKEKKAQKQRLAKAQQRLDDCEAAQA